MHSFGSIAWSSVGKKVITGLTGLALMGFIIAHLIGNFTLLLGPEAFNGYAHFLVIIVVGTGLAGGGAAASLGELGYNVKNFCIQDSPRRAHSIAAQGGINAAKNYQNDGDSIWRLFYDTVKGGDFRPARPTCTAWPRSPRPSSTSAWPRACPLPANTAAPWPTAVSVAPR
jgi:hypothetical protein